uniref:M-phase phosphoprotein 8 n=1 Tax=Salvator merianae TaxID=96440 RepID=A0A8D0CA49_SALMN
VPKMAEAASSAEEEEAAAASRKEAGEARDGAAAVAAWGRGGGGESEDDEDDVYEVEKILDVKTEDGKILYKVRWKGYSPDDDTWEPEEHLEDCKEVLLEFRKKIVDTKPKPVKKELQKLPLNDDLFEADSEADSDWQTDSKADLSPKKKKKKSKEKEKEDKNHDEIQKKKSKLTKAKERSALEYENSSDSLASDSKPKKRTSELKEDLKESKKQRREDVKDISKKKGDVKDGKKKLKEESKENKHLQKGKHSSHHLDAESSLLDNSLSPAGDHETVDLDSDSSEEKLKAPSEKDQFEERGVPLVQHPDSSTSTDDSFDVKVKRKKKKHKKVEELEEHKKLDRLTEKKSAHKKQKAPDKSKATTEPDNKKSSPVPGQKSLKLSTDERGRKSVDSAGEMTKKCELKEKLQKRLESEREEKNRKEQRGPKSLKEIKNAFDGFNISSEENNEYLDNRRREESAEEFRSKDRQMYNRSTRDETDTWAYIAAEGDRDVIEDSPDAKQQTVNLGMDMQLEWLSLEDFQKHLNGEGEDESPMEEISSAHLRDAIKNGNYALVKMALNSKEEYNLDQEDSSGMTLVMLAAAGGHDDILRLLIRKGAKVNFRQKNGTTALIHAAEKNNLTTVAILLEAGACVNLQQNSGETALMKACKRGNYDIVRLMIESGADCNISSNYHSNALHFAKQCNNLQVYELLTNHLATLSRVAEETIKEYFEAHLILMEPIFDIACHRLCEGPDYSSEFNYKPPQNVPEGSGILLFIFHANFFGKDVVARLCGPCSVQAVILNEKFQLPVFLDSHFIYSFSPIQGPNKLFIRLVEAPTAKVKLLIVAYRVQLQ